MHKSQKLSIGDRDNVVFNSKSKQLFAIDTNGRPPRIAAISNMFKTLAIAAAGNPPIDPYIYDLVTSPDTGIFFGVRRLSAEDERRQFVRYVRITNSFEKIGAMNSSTIIAFTAVPNDVARKWSGE